MCDHCLYLSPWSERAIKATGDKGIDAAMDWLSIHQDDDMSAETTEGAGETAAANEDTEMKETEAEQPGAVAKSLKCDEYVKHYFPGKLLLCNNNLCCRCGKLFKSSEEVEFHAAKTNHSRVFSLTQAPFQTLPNVNNAWQFSESTEEKKPLTEEEKKEQLRRVEELMKQKRKEREEKEKADQLEREKKRIQSGKELTNIKKKLEDEQLKKLADERRREKEEEKKARQRVKDMIEQDKLARKQKAEGATQEPQQPKPAVPAVAPAQTAPNQPKEYKETRIQIRLTDGSTLTQTFGAKEQLAAVRLFVNMKRSENSAIPDLFRLQTNFPKRLFNEEEYEKPLDALGLVPSAVLIVSKMWKNKKARIKFFNLFCIL